MARRRAPQFGNPVLGASMPQDSTLMQDASTPPLASVSNGRLVRISNPTQDSNDAAAQRQQDWNTRAAQQYEQVRQGRLVTSQNTDDAAVNFNLARTAIAKAFGYDPKNAPSMQFLMQRWASQSKPVQAGIIKAGGAQFIDPEQGQQIIQSLTDEHDKALQKFKDSVTEGIATGKVQFDPNPNGGAPTPYTYMDDPKGTGMKIKVPFNDMQNMALQSAIKDGSVPDAYNQATTAAQLNQKPLTTSQFQDVLDDRAETGKAIPLPNANGTIPTAQPTTAQFQQTLNARANPQDVPSVAASVAATLANKDIPITDSNASASQMSLTPYNYQSNMQLGTNYQYQNPLQLGASSSPVVAAAPATPVDVATALGQKARKLIGNTLIPSMEDTDIPNLGLTGVNMANYGLNIPSQIANAGGRFVGGLTGTQVPQIPLLPTKLYAKPTSDDAATAADLYDFSNPQGGP